MALRSFFAFDNEGLVVQSSSSAAIVGNPIINNSSTPNGTVFTFTQGSGRTITLDDTGGSVDTFEDDQSGSHTITEGFGMVPDGAAVEAESIIQLRALDSLGNPTGPTINITVFSQGGVTGNVWGFATDTPLQDGVSYEKISGNNNGSSSYANFVTCFGPGTLIETVDGERPLSALRVGTQVWTQDGFQAIAWIGRTVVPGFGAKAPVTIAAGALGNDRPLIVSQEHRLFFANEAAELLFGAPEILISAKHLCSRPGVSITPTPFVTYTHFMFDTHQVVRANGLLAESFFLSELSVSGTAQAARTELEALFPCLASAVARFGSTAALCLKRHEADVWCRLAA
ncbi:Hint domain-containing protein [uncultured Tateyamaria sp.]|uniref:Hint domain-containing protein n=1 Tax=Tateyamaria sp. 1078 TaxID=3417464 RepID=UPI0026336A76|nr:Hint domain-containing protein [uncultured Tateyamaria sp.]